MFSAWVFKILTSLMHCMLIIIWWLPNLFRMVFFLNSRFTYLVDWLKSLLTYVMAVSNSVCSKLNLLCCFFSPQTYRSTSLSLNKLQLYSSNCWDKKNIGIIFDFSSSFITHNHSVKKSYYLYLHNMTMLWPPYIVSSFTSCMSLFKRHFLRLGHIGHSHPDTTVSILLSSGPSSLVNKLYILVMYLLYCTWE